LRTFEEVYALTHSLTHALTAQNQLARFSGLFEKCGRLFVIIIYQHTKLIEKRNISIMEKSVDRLK
jgi:hypothetical protein